MSQSNGIGSRTTSQSTLVNAVRGANTAPFSQGARDHILEMWAGDETCQAATVIERVTRFIINDSLRCTGAEYEDAEYEDAEYEDAGGYAVIRFQQNWGSFEIEVEDEGHVRNVRHVRVGNVSNVTTTS